MAVTYTLKQGSRTSEQGPDWKRKYGVTYICVTDDPRIGAGTVRALCSDQWGNPIRLGTRYQVWTGPATGGGVLVEQDAGCFATSITATEDPESDDGLQWLVAVEYGPYDPSVWPINALDWPIRYWWEPVKFEAVADRDINQKQVCNSAGDLFDPPATRDDSRWLLVVERNEAKFDQGWADLYKDAVSTDVFVGRAAGEWKVDSIAQSEPIHDEDCGTRDGFYVKVTYKFAHNPDGWKLSILDQGYKQLDTSTTPAKLKPILDASGGEVKNPALLDGTGKPLSPKGTPKFLTFDIYKQLEYAKFNFDFTTAPTFNN